MGSENFSDNQTYSMVEHLIETVVHIKQLDSSFIKELLLREDLTFEVLMEISKLYLDGLANTKNTTRFTYPIDLVKNLTKALQDGLGITTSSRIEKITNPAKGSHFRPAQKFPRRLEKLAELQLAGYNYLSNEQKKENFKSDSYKLMRLHFLTRAIKARLNLLDHKIFYVKSNQDILDISEFFDESLYNLKLSKRAIIEYVELFMGRNPLLDIGSGNKLQEIIIQHGRFLVELGTCYYILNQITNDPELFVQSLEKLNEVISFKFGFPNIHLFNIERVVDLIQDPTIDSNFFKHLNRNYIFYANQVYNLYRTVTQIWRHNPQHSPCFSGELSLDLYIKSLSASLTTSFINNISSTTEESTITFLNDLVDLLENNIDNLDYDDATRIWGNDLLDFFRIGFILRIKKIIQEQEGLYNQPILETLNNLNSLITKGYKTNSPSGRYKTNQKGKKRKSK